MLVTEDFVFVHVPKTGGSFVRTLFRMHLRVLHEQPHGSYDTLPPEFAGLPAFRFVRNPWDWYVSHYHYAALQGKPGLAGELFFGPNRDAPYAEFITSVCTPPELPPSVAGPGPRWMRAMRELDCDFYTALDHVMVGGRPEVEAARFEHLREDLLAFLERHDIEVGEAFREAILSEPPIHPPFGPTGRGLYQQYYDERLRDLVGSRCPIVARHGYTFEGEPTAGQGTAHSRMPDTRP